jgi:PTS system galactitol-specific IIA component
MVLTACAAAHTLVAPMIEKELSLARLEARTAEDVIRALAQRLHARGAVKDGFEAAALLRERRSPTGLPFPGVAVALPHAEPEHVIESAIAIATLAAPVRFRQMGDPRTELDVSIVVMPALSAKEHAAAGLTRLIELLQDPSRRATLVAAEDADALARAWGA